MVEVLLLDDGSFGMADFMLFAGVLGFGMGGWYLNN